MITNKIALRNVYNGLNNAVLNTQCLRYWELIYCRWTPSNVAQRSVIACHEMIFPFQTIIITWSEIDTLQNQFENYVCRIWFVHFDSIELDWISFGLCWIQYKMKDQLFAQQSLNLYIKLQNLCSIFSCLRLHMQRQQICKHPYTQFTDTI